MSSARNHARRSRRSYHYQKAAIGVANRKMYLRRDVSIHRFHLFRLMANMLRRRQPKAKPQEA